jgi:hypothetical protein
VPHSYFCCNKKQDPNDGHVANKIDEQPQAITYLKKASHRFGGPLVH